MVKRKVLGVALVLVILVSSIYFLMPNKIRIDIQDSRTKYSVMENGSFVLAATEYVSLYDGSTQMRASSRDVIYWNDSEYAYASRTSKWKDNITTIQTYTFKINNNDVENFPLKNKLQCINCQGKIVHYEIRDILYEGNTTQIGSPFAFGHNMVIEWQDGAYYSKVFQQKVASDKIIIKYRPLSNYVTYSVRLTDPEPKKENVTIDFKTAIDVGYQVNKDTQGVTLDINHISANKKCLNITLDSDLVLNSQDFEIYIAESSFNASKVSAEDLEKRTELTYDENVTIQNCTLVNKGKYGNGSDEITNECDPYNIKVQRTRVVWSKVGKVSSLVTENLKTVFPTISKSSGKSENYRYCFNVPLEKKGPVINSAGTVYVKLGDNLLVDKQGSTIWNSSWLNWRDINITNVDSTNLVRGFTINLTANTKKMRADGELNDSCADLRIVCSGIEVDRVFVNETVDQPADFPQGCMHENSTIHFMWNYSNITSGGQNGTTCYMAYNYDGNPTAAPNNGSNVYIHYIKEGIVNGGAKDEVNIALNPLAAYIPKYILKYHLTSSLAGNPLFYLCHTNSSACTGTYWRYEDRSGAGTFHRFKKYVGAVNIRSSGGGTTSNGRREAVFGKNNTATGESYNISNTNTNYTLSIDGVEFSGFTTRVFDFYNLDSLATIKIDAQADSNISHLILARWLDEQPIVTLGSVQPVIPFISIKQSLEATYWDSDELDYSLNVSVYNFDSSAQTINITVDNNFNTSTSISLGSIPAHSIASMIFTNLTALRRTVDTTFNITAATATDGTNTWTSNKIGMFIPGQVGVAGGGGDPLCVQYLQVDSFTGLLINYNLTVQCVNPKTDVNFTTVTITPSVGFGGATTISINANTTNQTSFYNTSSRGISDGVLFAISGADITENITLTTNPINHFVPIDPPYAFTKDGIVDCDQNMFVNKDINLSIPVTFRGTGEFLISAILRVAGYNQPADKSCQIVINGSGSLEVTK